MEQEILIRVNAAMIGKKELAIIEDMSHGLSCKEIAVKREISSRTVEVHRHNILKKTGCKNSIHLIASFLRKGLIK